MNGIDGMVGIKKLQILFIHPVNPVYAFGFREDEIYLEWIHRMVGIKTRLSPLQRVNPAFRFSEAKTFGESLTFYFRLARAAL